MQLNQAGWLFTDMKEQFATRVFEPLYGTRELHCSKDGFTFQRPTRADLRRTENDHFDQGMHWLGLQCIQGSVALTDQGPNDGCFQVWPGSHKYREQLLHRRGNKSVVKRDFVMLSEDERQFLHQQGIRPRRVPVEQGDVILFRSDVAHAGAPPIGRCDTCRVVSYVCCLPASLTPDAVYPQKFEAYRTLQTGSHWPSREEWFEVVERHRRIAWRPFFISPPMLSDRQRQLFGLDRYGEDTESTDHEVKCGIEEQVEEQASKFGNEEQTSGCIEVVSGKGALLAVPNTESGRPTLAASAPRVRRWSKKA